MIVRNTRSAREVVRAGFTLMEVMVVVAIILVLAGVGGVVYMRHLDDANMSRAKIDLKSLTSAVEMYKSRYQKFPDQLADLAKQQPNGGASYITEDALYDPWGQPYVYEPTALHSLTHKPRISCQTPSGPISNWDSLHSAANAP